jgi:hypothetical protein
MNSIKNRSENLSPERFDTDYTIKTEGLILRAGFVFCEQSQFQDD